MNSDTRIKLEMTVIETVMALSEGNPGAMTVCAGLINNGAKIDTDSALGGFGQLLSLDSHGIYGSRIWMLYKDVCKQSLPHTIAVLRAHQLGLGDNFTREKIDHAIDNYGEGMDIEEAMRLVQERLPKFNASELEAVDG